MLLHISGMFILNQPLLSFYICWSIYEAELAIYVVFFMTGSMAGADPGGGGAPVAPPPPPKIGKNMICWRKIAIFHTKYPKKIRVYLRSAQFL